VLLVSHLNPFYSYTLGIGVPVPVAARSTAARLLKLWFRNPPGACMFVSCECCVWLGRGLCDELIIRSDESYQMWCVVGCDLATSRMWRPYSALGGSATEKYVGLIQFNNVISLS